MMKFNLPFAKKAATRVGLDIGSYNLKVVEVEEKEGVFNLLNAGMKDIREVKNISGAITELLKETGVSAKKVNISVSGESVVARYLSLPKMSDAELKKAMAFELEDHIPFKPEEVYTDYQVLGEERNSKNRVQVFLVATKKDLVDERVRMVREAGLEAQVITTDAIALKNAFYFNYPSKNETNVALLNIGDKITNLLITRDKTPYFVRDTRFGGDAITALIQTKAQMEKKKAEELKHNLAGASADILEVIKTAMGTLLNEIFVSLDFYENLTEERIDEIYISGGSAHLPGLKEFLSGYLNLQILPLEPFKNFSLAPHISKEELAPLSRYFSVAVGLALEKT